MIAGWFLACTLLAGGPDEEPPRSALDDEAYRFCFEPGASGAEAEAWCDLVQRLPPDRCPGLQETCADGLFEEETPRGCNEGAEGGAADRLAGAPPPPRRPTGCEPPDPQGLQSLLRWVAAIAVAVGILLLFRLLWATFGRRVAPPPAPSISDAIEAVNPDDLPEGVPDAPVADLLAAARRALAEGRPSESVLLARGAALRHLGEAGLIRLHRARTDREYLRSVQDAEALRTDLREVFAPSSEHRFGGRVIDPDRARSALGAAERLIGAGLVLLALSAGGAAHAQSAMRFSPSGDAALFRVFELAGYDVGWRLRSLADLDDTTDVLVLDVTAVEPTEEQWEHLATWVGDGGVLMVGGDATAGFSELGTFSSLTVGAKVSGSDWLLVSGLPVPRWPEGAQARFRDGAGRTLVHGWGDDGLEAGAVVELLDHGAGAVIAIADARLLWNGAMVDPANEEFLADLPYVGQAVEGWPMQTPAVVQLATLASVSASGGGGGGCNNPVESMANARLLALVLQVLATTVLIVLWRGWPFAPLRDPPDAGRTSFVEHVRALGTRYRQLGASGHAARAYASMWLARLGPAGLEWAALRSGHTPAEARAFVQRIEAVTHGTAKAASPEDLERVEELWRITKGNQR